MSWFDAKTLSKYAKTALKQAQKNIDKVLDIKDDVATDTATSYPNPHTSTPNSSAIIHSRSGVSGSTLASDDTFFDSFFENSETQTKNKNQSAVTKFNNKTEKVGNEAESSNNSSIFFKNNSSNKESLQTGWDDFSDVDIKIPSSKKPLKNPVTHSETAVSNIVEHKLQHEKIEASYTNQYDCSGKNKNIEVSSNKEISYGATCEENSFQNHQQNFLTNENTMCQDVNGKNSFPLQIKEEKLIDLKIDNKLSNPEKNCVFVKTIVANDPVDSSLFLDSSISNTQENTYECLPSDIVVNNQINKKLSASLSSDTLADNEEIADNQESADNQERLGKCLPSYGIHLKETDSENDGLFLLDQITEQVSNMNKNIGFDGEDKSLSRKEDQHKTVENKTAKETDISKVEEVIFDAPCNNLQNDSFSQVDISEDTKEIKRLKCVLEAREIKMVELSRENIKLSESNNSYKNQLEQYETTLKQKDEREEELRHQLTKTFMEAESKLQLVIKERDALKQKLAAAELQIQKSEKDLQMSLSQSVAEKEETIKALLEEGEALSKKELENNIKIKKLRLKLKDVMAKNEKFSVMINDLNVETQRCKDLLTEKEKELKLQEAELIKLHKMTDSQEDEITALKESIDDNDEKYKAMEATLQIAYAEINKLNLEKAQKESEANEGSAAIAMKKELELKIKELEKISSFDREELLRQMDDLQIAYSRLEQQSARQENYFKREVQDLLKRLEEGENRNQELLHSVSTATRPLLRQIENLQTSHSKQVENWERVEFNLTSRLGDMQQQLALAIEKERSATEIVDELKAKCKALETEYRRIKQEKSMCDEILEEEQSKRKSIEEILKREISQHETKNSNLKKMYDGVLNEKSFLEEQLAAERLRYENDISQLASHHSNVKLDSLSRQSSVDSIIKMDETDATQKNVDIWNSSLHSHTNASSSSLQEWSSGMRSTTTIASLEQLNSQLRKRDGELFLLREEVSSLERTRASLARDLVSASSKLEELEAHSQELENFKSKYEELSNRYNAMLQMYGEKEEENEELKMDLQDVKALYKQQVQELLLSTR